MDAAAVRSVALQLPEAEEYEHAGLPAFRVRGNRFAARLDAGSSTVDLMLGEAGIREAAAAWPEHCSERWFAGRLDAARVDFAEIDPGLLRELVTDAWRNRAPVVLRRLLG
jgi:hypothetical protein